MIAVFLENGTVSVRESARPDRAPGEALLRLRCGGICNTDLELQRGYYGFSGIPGHEFVAEVVESENPALRGRRVVGEINLPCRDCEWCRRGLGRHCPGRTVLGIVRRPGAFQEYFTLPEDNLHMAPEGVPDEAAVFTEPAAAACEILEQVSIPPGDKVAVLGDGKLGLLAAQVLALHGCAVRLFGKHPGKLRIAESAGIAVEIVASGDLPRAAYDWVVEATGSPEGLRQAARMTRPRGTLVMKSTVHGTVPVDVAPLVVDEITLVGSRCGRFEAALPLIASGRLRTAEMISDRFPLREAARAFARAAERGALKILLEA